MVALPVEAIVTVEKTVFVCTIVSGHGRVKTEGLCVTLVETVEVDGVTAGLRDRAA